MAFETPPIAMDGTTADAEAFRRAIGSLIGSAGGIVTPGDCLVAQQASPNMSVQIAPGQVWVPGTSTASQGPYYSRNGAATTVVISASSPSNPRIDTIIAQVQDAVYAGAVKQIAAAVVTGTPTAGATLVNLNGAGAVPASSLILAYVLVPTSAVSIVTANIANVVPLIVPSRALATPTTVMSNPTRVLGTAYQPNAARPTLVVVDFVLPTAAEALVKMDAANPPTTIIADLLNNPTGQVNMAFTFLVPPGFFYKFQTGGGAPTILNTFEFAL